MYKTITKAHVVDNIDSSVSSNIYNIPFNYIYTLLYNLTIVYVFHYVYKNKNISQQSKYIIIINTENYK